MKVTEATEEWRWIRRYKNYYQVSTHGRVKSKTRHVQFMRMGRLVTACVKGRVIRQGDNTHGYATVCLTKNATDTTCKVHRLVARTFVPNPNNLPCVNHKDGNKRNNHYSNLEWCSHRQNMKHSRKHKLSPGCGTGEANHQSKLTWKSVRKMRTLFNKGVPIKKLVEKFGTSYDNLRYVVNNLTWKERS